MERQRHDRFAGLFVRNQNRVYRYLLTLVPNRSDAEELFQQTNLTLWETWERFEPQVTEAGETISAQAAEDQFVRWACGIAHNHVRNFVRKKQTHQLLVDESVLEHLGEWRLANEDLLEHRRQALGGCLEKLPAAWRTLVERIYAGADTVQGAAAASQQTPNAVYKTLNRIRSALYDCINRQLAAEGTA